MSFFVATLNMKTNFVSKFQVDTTSNNKVIDL